MSILAGDKTAPSRDALTWVLAMSLAWIDPV